MSRLNATAPKYMASFACIGSACEENCCHGWSVSINKATFKRYRDCADTDLAPRLKENVVRREGSGNPTADYARIKLKEDGACPFLSADALCDIQGKLGASALSTTCSTYPRQYNAIDATLSLTASLSCPEAARKALLDPDAMEPVEVATDFAHPTAVPLSLGLRNLSRNPVSAARLAVHEAAVALLGNPTLDAVEALVLIGMLTRRVEESIAAGDPANLAAEVDKAIHLFTAPMTVLEARQLIGGLAIDLRLQMLLLKEMTVEYMITVGGRPSFRAMVADAVNGLAYRDDDVAGSAARYQAAGETWYKPFVATRQHLLKNYLRNDVLRTFYPLSGKEPGMRAFYELAVRFGLIQMYLIGLSAGLREGFDEASFVRVIYTFVRNIEHNPAFLPRVIELLDSNGHLNLATMMTLLKV